MNIQARQYDNLKGPHPITFKDKLQLNRDVRNWHQKFDYMPCNISELKSIFLDNYAKFQDLKSSLQTYNDEMKYLSLQDKDKNPVHNGPLKQAFYKNLMNLMRQIVLTKDRQNQLLLVDKVHNWMQQTLNTMIRTPGQDKKQRRTKSQGNQKPFIETSFNDTTLDGSRRYETTTRPNTTIQDEDDNKTIKLNSIFQSTSKEKAPSQMIEEQLHDYRLQARTQHQSVDAPNNRLTGFRRRNISLVKEIHLRPNLNQTFTAQTKSTFPDKYQFVRTQTEGMRKIVRLTQQSNESQSDAQEEDQEEDLENLANEIEKQKEQLLSDKNHVAAKSKTFKLDQADLPAPHKEPQSNYQYHQQGAEKAEKKLEKRWHDTRNKFVAEKREDEEMVHHIQNWSKNRGRMEKEILRKIEVQRVGSEFTKCGIDDQVNVLNLDELLDKKEYARPAEEEQHDDGSESESLYQSVTTKRQKKKETKFITLSANFRTSLKSTKDETLEAIIDNKRITNIKTFYSNILKLNQSDDMSYVPPGLSVYDRKLRSTRAFSNIVKRTPNDQTKQQLDEIQEIKSRMAKYKLNVPLNRLMTAIMTPSSTKQKSDELPEPGYGLLENPFRQEVKKKKGRRS